MLKVLLTGTFDQVIGAFDMITEVSLYFEIYDEKPRHASNCVVIQFLQQGDNATTFPAHTRNPELTQINLLLEHSKVSDQIFCMFILGF